MRAAVKDGAGTAELSGDGGPATAAGPASPLGITANNADALVMADVNNNRVREVPG